MSAMNGSRNPRSSRNVAGVLSELFAENIAAKVYRAAARLLMHLPGRFPEYVPQDGIGRGAFQLRDASFWTCGFFPGTMYAVLERSIRFPQTLSHLRERQGESTSEDGPVDLDTFRTELLALCKVWSEPLHAMSHRTDTHDIGFIVMPALRADWELLGSRRSLESIIRAAQSLASRYLPDAGVILSWELLRQVDREIVSDDDNAIIIIDSLCNLDLLYYAAVHCPPKESKRLFDIATHHARALLTSHLRPETALQEPDAFGPRYSGQWYSTCHVAILEPRTGNLKQRLTHQGYADNSTWARGQSWAILGYAQTYMWTKDEAFLWAACGCAEYFLCRLEETAVSFAAAAPVPTASSGRYCPLWDFDAPLDDRSSFSDSSNNASNVVPQRDSSAGVIAANGMLVLSQALAAVGAADHLAIRFREAAIAIVGDILDFALADEKVTLVYDSGDSDFGGRDGASGSKDSNGVGLGVGLSTRDVTPQQTFEGILKSGTANNNAGAKKRYANHGLVYGDYYLVEFGNKLLRMGLM